VRLVKVPLIVTEPPPEFGELKTSPEFFTASGMDRDVTYVPGFSELRYARDAAILEVMRGKRRPQDVPTLPVNFRWARCQNKKGDPDNRKVIRHGNRGYRLVTKDLVGEGKLLPEIPAGARWGADGTLMQGDTVLMVADAAQVARNEFEKRARTASATRGAEAGFAAALEAVGGKPAAGAAPFITKDVGQRTRAELSPKTKAKET